VRRHGYSRTGRRLVSVPFADHCAPLIDSDERSGYLASHLRREVSEGREQYVETRSIATGAGVPTGFAESDAFCLHRLDLHRNVDELFGSFHANCIRRKIRRAEREGLTCQQGTSEELLRTFYQLFVPSRRRQGVPPAAGIITIRYKSVMTYKYGCSDPCFQRFGPVQLLMWRGHPGSKGGWPTGIRHGPHGVKQSRTAHLRG
jgi:hypothetical protein